MTASATHSATATATISLTATDTASITAHVLSTYDAFSAVSAAVTTAVLASVGGAAAAGGLQSMALLRIAQCGDMNKRTDANTDSAASAAAVLPVPGHVIGVGHSVRQRLQYLVLANAGALIIVVSVHGCVAAYLANTRGTLNGLAAARFPGIALILAMHLCAGLAHGGTRLVRDVRHSSSVRVGIVSLAAALTTIVCTVWLTTWAFGGVLRSVLYRQASQMQLPARWCVPSAYWTPPDALQVGGIVTGGLRHVGHSREGQPWRLLRVYSVAIGLVCAACSGALSGSGASCGIVFGGLGAIQGLQLAMALAVRPSRVPMLSLLAAANHGMCCGMFWVAARQWKQPHWVQWAVLAVCVASAVLIIIAMAADRMWGATATNAVANDVELRAVAMNGAGGSFAGESWLTSHEAAARQRSKKRFQLAIESGSSFDSLESLESSLSV
jgi:hypothetical protein